ncbi:hypothetical protein ACFL5J_02255 [Thermodesulfobacteriota bacterium]
MATATRAFVAGFLAALKMYEAGNTKKIKNSRPLTPQRRTLPPMSDRAMESYLAIPTFIRQGRLIKG